MSLIDCIIIYMYFGPVASYEINILYLVSCILFQCDAYVVDLIVLCFGVQFLCCLRIMHVFVVLVKFE